MYLPASIELAGRRAGEWFLFSADYSTGAGEIVILAAEEKWSATWHYIYENVNKIKNYIQRNTRDLNALSIIMICRPRKSRKTVPLNVLFYIHTVNYACKQQCVWLYGSLHTVCSKSHTGWILPSDSHDNTGINTIRFFFQQVHCLIICVYNILIYSCDVDDSKSVLL